MVSAVKSSRKFFYTALAISIFGIIFALISSRRAEAADNWHGLANPGARYDIISQVASLNNKSILYQTVDSSGKIYVLFVDYDTDPDQYYLTVWNGTSWVKMDGTAGAELISSGAAVKISFDNNGNLGMAYDYLASISERRVLFRKWDKIDNRWEAMNGMPGYDTVFAIPNYCGNIYAGDFEFDSNNYPQIVFGRIYCPGGVAQGGTYDFYFTRWNGSQWTTASGALGYENITNHGNPSSIDMEINNNNYPNVAYYLNISGFFTCQEVYFRRWNGSAWVSMSGATARDNISGHGGADCAFFPRVTLDRSSPQRPYITWIDDTGGNSNVWLTRWNYTNNRWETMSGVAGNERITNTNNLCDAYSSFCGFWAGHKITIDSANNPHLNWHLNYTDIGAYDIYYSTYNGGWKKADGSSGADKLTNGANYTWYYQEMKLDSSNKPILSIVDNSEQYFARWSSANSRWEGMNGLPGLENISQTSGGTYNFSFNAHLSLIDDIPYIGWADGTTGKFEIYFTRWLGDTDIGLKYYDGAQIVSIAAEPLGTLTSPLRISKGGNTYGLILVDPADPNASKIRINTSAGVRALKKYQSGIDLNWSVQPGSVASGNGSHNCGIGGIIEGVPNNIRDDNITTYYRGNVGTNLGNCTFTYTDQITFPAPKIINSVEINHRFIGYQTGPGALGQVSYEVAVLIGGSWSTVISRALAPAADTTTTTTSSTGWNNVSAVRIIASGSAASGGSYTAVADHRTFELRAWGP